MTPVDPLARPRRLSRRSLLALLPSASLGLLAVPTVRDRVLAAGLALNDRVGAGLFATSGLVPTFADRELTPPAHVPVNSYDIREPAFDPASWSLFVEGEVARPGAYPLARIRELTRHRQNVRHVCIEGWSVVCRFGGVRLADFLHMVGANPAAPYVEVACLDDYYTTYDMASCLHPQTLLCDEMYDRPLTRAHGAPLRVHMPVKLGYKSAKALYSLRVTSTRPRTWGYWEDQGYPWHGGL